MRRSMPVILAAVILATSARSALAQADAQQAYQQAKAAYDGGKFAQARDLARKASETDNKNPEVFLLVGKSHYQLGELEEALAAWKRTLALAPQEPFATQMLSVLQGKQADADTRIKLLEVLIAERLYAPAFQEAAKLLDNKAMTGPQRAKARTLHAELLIRTGKPLEAEAAIRELLALQPKEADPLQTTLLLGQAKLRAGGEATSEGLALLRKLSAEQADTPAAATAQYELAAFALAQEVDQSRTEVLAKWLSANAAHPLAREARLKLVGAYLQLTRQGPLPTPETELAPTDQAALTVAIELLKQTPRAEEAAQLTGQITAHLEEHYAKRGAAAAAAKGLGLLVAAPLPRPSRLAILRAQARVKTGLALKTLDELARTGKLPADLESRELPPVLADVLGVFSIINNEYPADAAWAEQVNLAKQVHDYAARVPKPLVVRQLTGPDAWAIDLALPVVGARADAGVTQPAIEMVQAIAKGYADLGTAATWALALPESRKLVAVVPANHPAWIGAITHHASLLDAFARFQFSEHLKVGKAQLNAKLSETQKEMMQTLGRLASGDVQTIPATLKLTSVHLQPWIEHGHWEIAEEAYKLLASALPASQRREAEVAVATLWVQKAFGEHQRLVAAGLAVPRELDPTLKRAALNLYELHAGLDSKSTALTTIRALWESIVDHYRALEYFEVAEAVAQVKPEKKEAAVDLAEEFSEFQLTRLKEEQARRQLARALKQYGATEKITLSPEFEDAIAAWTKFIAERPASPLASQAVERIFQIGQLFQQQGAPLVSADVYGKLAQFAQGVPMLSEAAIGASSTAERAAMARANALDAQGRKSLAKALADRKKDDPPPAKLSEDLAGAVAAYKSFVETHPQSPLAGQAIAKMMAISYEYAKIDAWAVAEAIYADLLGSKLAIAHPERLKFGRGMCQLGRAMPDHTREVLAVLSAEGPRPSSESGAPSATAVAGNADSAKTPVGVGALALGPPSDANAPAAPASPPVATAASAPANEAPAQADRQPGLDAQLLATIRRQESSRAAQVAQLRDHSAMNFSVQAQAQQQEQTQQAVQQPAQAPPMLSEAEVIRQDQAIQAAYDIFQGIRRDHAEAPTADQARGEILVMVAHWRSLSQWQRSAALALRFLADNPNDSELPRLRLEVARDRLTWAARPVEKDRKATRHDILTEVAKRFAEARAELGKIVTDFSQEPNYQQQAQWEIATSFLAEARVVALVSSTLARGQYVRASKELGQVTDKYPDHPQIASIPQALWNIAQELETRQFDDEAILVWNELLIRDPNSPLAQQAALKIAQTYQQKLKLPLRAAEAYQELNFIRGGNDLELQNAIFQIGSQLKDQKRWVEALHILETFVDSYPKHPQAGQALTMVGQIHQTNEAWQDAIAAYRRVINEFTDGQFVQEAKWAIAECTINLSQWREASAAYRAFVAAYPQDAKVAEANRRIEVLKDLERYQGLVDEKDQRKAFDAQYQIAVIVAGQLANPVKAIIEYRKVATDYPDSHLADDALYSVGTTYMSLGETEKAREALRSVAQKYPTSPLADDSLLMIGKSYESEADKLAAVTREKTLEEAKDVAQRNAYRAAQSSRREQQKRQQELVLDLKKAGKLSVAEAQEASSAANFAVFNDANVRLVAQKAGQEMEALTAAQLADRQDKINAALRRAVQSYTAASKVPGADKAGDALQQMATIYDQRLKDSKAAMETWLEIVRQFSGTAVAEDASWRIAQYYEREGKHAEAIEAYQAFLRNYRRSPNAGAAQFASAENYERLGKWVNAMDAYTNYITNFPDGPLAPKAKEQINWIKTYRL